MFPILFKYPRVLAHHCEGPAADERQRFLIHRAKEGATRGTLLGIARELLVIAKHIDVVTDKAISIYDLEAAASRWVRHQLRRHRARGSKWSREWFIHVARTWLHFLGRLQEQGHAPSPSADLMKDFANYMRNERGLSEATIRGRCWHAGKFLDELIAQNRPFAEVSVIDVDAFLTRKGSQGWGRVSVATSARALRSFFRRAEMRGWCEVGVATGIDGPRLFKQEALPVGLLWTDVQRLITSTTGDRPRDIRDQAILMLLAIYGFRSREVAGLRLEQMNWEREILGVLRPKQRRAQEYPQRKARTLDPVLEPETSDETILRDTGNSRETHSRLKADPRFVDILGVHSSRLWQEAIQQNYICVAFTDRSKDKAAVRRPRHSASDEDALLNETSNLAHGATGSGQCPDVSG
jgi:integrase